MNEEKNEFEIDPQSACCYSPKEGASLGCGTWILLVIVLGFFSGGIRDRITGNQSRLNNIETKIESLEEKLNSVLKLLEGKLEDDGETTAEVEFD